ncbi:MAG: TonB-dependent receptor plug domain-containing protein [Bryobacterales bacterium]|nr:TonB-dependent receptor plug domain-containing protein [Bryobacterales bacterium]
MFAILISFLLLWAGAAEPPAGSSAQGAGQVTGRVTDTSGAAVPDAIVQLQARDGRPALTARTDAQGGFKLTSVAPSAYWMTAEASGLASSPEAIGVRAGETVERDVTVRVTPMSTQVVITAASTAQSTDEVSKAFDVIDSKQLDRREEYSLVEALRLTPGLRIAQLGGPGSLARVQTRGMRTFDTSVLIDGFRFRDTSAPQGDAMGFFGDLLLADTARTEVLRGSGSSLYGTHAMGGVINVVTEQGGGPAHGELTVEGGGLGLFRGTAKMRGGIKNDRVKYAAGITHLNVTSGVDGDDRYRNTSGQGSVWWRARPATTYGVRLFASDNFTGLNVAPFALTALPSTSDVRAVEGVTFSRALNDPDARRAGRFVSTLATVTHQFTPAASFRGNYQYMGTERDNRDGPVGPRFQPAVPNSNLFASRVDTAQLRTDLMLPWRHFLSGGYEYERERYDNRSVDENAVISLRTAARVEVNQASHALFVQDQWRTLGDRLQVMLSGRWQRFDLARPRFTGGSPQYANTRLLTPPDAKTGDVALSYFVPKTGTKLRAHAGNSYRVPTLYERFGYSFFMGSFSPYGDPLLAPERSLAGDAGIDQYFANSRVRVSATAFYTRLQQVIGFDFSGLINPESDPYGRFSGYRNTGGGLARGVELSGEASVSRLTRVHAAYTYTNADERSSTLVGGSVSSIRISPHMATALVTHQFTRHLDVTMDLFAASKYVYPLFAGGSRPFVFKGPVKMDIVARYSRMAGDRIRWELYTRIENALNRVYYEDGFATPKAWAVAGVKIGF